ncbi:hypothetical protein XmelCFBP4644_12170 [Xanthomonas melonis]|uniref:Uncharacterized protein n=1 Tax=Xanthomonas melonis TaxID=56456 RepID=A0A2S7DEH8_9XANT|nr:hypothetical protein XmelCFBP4644_12170 [Xanthomonas melonis]
MGRPAWAEPALPCGGKVALRAALHDIACSARWLASVREVWGHGPDHALLAEGAVCAQDRTSA